MDLIKKLKEGKQLKSEVSDRIIVLRDIGGGKLCFYEVAKDGSGRSSTNLSYAEIEGGWKIYKEEKKTLSSKCYTASTKPTETKMYKEEDVKQTFQDIKEDFREFSENLLIIEALDEIINKRAGKRLI